MVEYTKVNLKLSNTQLKKLKDADKNNTRTTLTLFRMGGAKSSPLPVFPL